MIEITESEAKSLFNHLEYYIIKEVQDDVDYDSMEYLSNLVHVYEKCKEVADG